MLPTIASKDIPGADPEQLLLCFQPFIRKTALRYSSLLEKTGAVDIDDLIQAGNIALLKAQKKFDPEQGVSFVGFAFDYLRSGMRVTLGFRGNEPPPTFDYLDAPIKSDDPDAGSMIDMIADPNAIDAAEYYAEEADKGEVVQQVRAAVARIKSARQREAIQRVYLDGQDRKTAADEMGIDNIKLLSLKRLGQDAMRHDWRLKRFAYPRYNTGLKRFNNTFTSQQEEYILWKEEMGML